MNGANFASFTEYVGELRGICVIRWNFFAKRQGVNLKILFVILEANVYG